jgi:hypothetical protein
MSEWQAISTAPKDGTPVLLFEPGDDEGVCFHIGRFARTPGFRKRPARDGWVIASGWLAFDEPTHWMPLPAPPER